MAERTLMKARFALMAETGETWKEDAVIDLTNGVIYNSRNSRYFSDIEAKKLRNGETLEVKYTKIKLEIPCPFCDSYFCWEKNKGECRLVHMDEKKVTHGS